MGNGTSIPVHMSLQASLCLCVATRYVCVSTKCAHIQELTCMFEVVQDEHVYVYVCVSILIYNSGTLKNIPSVYLSPALLFFSSALLQLSPMLPKASVLLVQDTSNILPLQFISVIHSTVRFAYFRSRWK